MDSSNVEVKKEIKEENIESLDVPIKNETKSNFKLEFKKERKDNLSLQIGLDIIDRLDLPVKNEAQEDFNPDIEVKKNTNGNEFPKGATMFMKVKRKGFKNHLKLKKEDIKEALMETFGIEDKAFASIETGNYESKSCGYVIFYKENAANELLAKIKGRSERFKIKGANIICRVVEEQEENAWHQHLARKNN